MVFLIFPAAFPSPLLNQPFPVGLYENLVLVVAGFEKERYPQNGEGQRLWCIGKGIAQDFVDCAVQVPLPDVTVWSHSIGYQFDTDDEGR